MTNIDLNYSIQNDEAQQTELPTFQYDVNGDPIDTGGRSALYQDETKENYLNLNIHSEYAHTFSEAHDVKVMGGFQVEEMKQDNSSMWKAGLMFRDRPEFNLTTGLDDQGNEIPATLGGSHYEWATAGFFGRLNYNYDERYLLEVNMRYDGTSRFREGRRWSLSPSFSAGWNIANEEFWDPLSDVANQLKLRFSYGELSNQNTYDWYPTYRTMNLGVFDGSWLQNGQRPNTASVGGLVSSGLTWERVQQWNVGLDYGLFEDRLTGSFDYFTRYTKDMVGPAPELPATLGISAPQSNNTDLHTKGWEVSLSWRDQLDSGLGYGISMNLSDQITVIDSYPSNKTQSIDTYIGGKRDALIWGYETIGIAQTDEEMQEHLAEVDQSALGSQWGAGDIMYRDLNGDGQIDDGARTLNDHGDLKVLGDSYSHYFFGIDLTANYKGFDFRTFLQGVMEKKLDPTGSKLFWGVPGWESRWHIRGYEEHQDYFRDEPIGLEGHEIPANKDAYYPRPIASNGGKNQMTQTRYLQNARYLRVKNVQLGYTVSPTWLQRVGITRARVSVSGENLLTFTPLSDLFDPETVSGGVGGNAYPLSRVWSFGVNLTF